MSFTRWLRTLQSAWPLGTTAGTGRRKARSRPAPRCRPCLESLEDRFLLSAGQLDPTFGVGGKVLTDIGVPSNNQAAALTITQTDGKVVVVGTGAPFGGYEFDVARYNPDGSFDGDGRVSFNVPGSGEGSPTSVALDSSGRIVVAGWAYFYGSTGDDFAVARLNVNGSLDTSFHGNGMVTIDFGPGYTEDVATGVALDAAGRIVVSGTTANADYGPSVVDAAVTRLNTDGSLDASFGTAGKATVSLGTGYTTDYNTYPYLISNTAALDLDSAGRILIAGYTSNSSTGYDFAVTRLTADGTLDSSFGSGGETTVSFGTGNTYDIATSMALDAGGRIVVAGYTNANDSTGWRFAVTRLNTDGSLDANFGAGGKATAGFGTGFTSDYATGMALDAAGRIVVAGYTDDIPGNFWDFAVTRLNTDGTLDVSYGANGKATVNFGPGGTDDRAAGVALDAAGRIVVAGTTRDPSVGGTGYDFAVARLDSGGNLDSTWGSGGKVATDFLVPTGAAASNLTVSQPDGKIVVVGSTYSSTDAVRLVVARYNSDGSPDLTFHGTGQATFRTSAWLGFNPTAAAVDASGRIVIVGYTYGPTTDAAVVRVNADGSLDSSFGTSGTAIITFGAGRDAQAVALDAAGRIDVAGTLYKDSYGGTSDALVTRLNPDGSLDTGFGTSGRATVSYGPGTAAGASSIALDAAGRIVLAGTTSSSYYSTDFAVTRLNADGSLDTGFGNGGKATVDFGNGEVASASSMAVDAAGRIVVAGTSHYYDYPDYHFAVTRLNADGSLDTGFGAAGKTTLSFGTSSPNTYDYANRLAIDPAGRIAVVGSSGGSSGTFFAVALLKANGCPDLDFGTGGTVTTDFAGVATGVAFDGTGRLIVAGSTSPGGYSEFAVLRYLTQDPVVEAGSATFAADLQAAVTALHAATPLGTPRVVVHVSDPAQMPAVVTAIAGLSVNPAGPEIEILLDVEPGTYSLGQVSVPAGLRLIIDGFGGQTFAGSSAPALSLVSGEMVVRNGVVFTSTGNTPTIVVQGGHLTMRGSTVEESSSSTQAAIAITGGLVDLGTTDQYGTDPGLNTITVHGKGLLIRNTGPNDVLAGGNTFFLDGVSFADDFRIEDAIDHSLDGLEGGTVFWVPGNVFVSANRGSVQRGVDLVPVGGTVNVESGVHGDFAAGAKLLTVAFQDGSSMTQQMDDLDPTWRSVVVMGTYGNDTIHFEPGPDKGIRVNMNHVPSGSFLPTGRLIAIGQDGSDDIEVSDGITLSAWLYGGISGNNHLQGGGGNDVLIGGYGNDTLSGGGGRDLLIAAGGSDHLDGKSGDDILIGGVTQYDDAAYNPDSEAALAAIMAEWTSGQAYGTRINDVVNGGGLNGAYILNGSVYYDGGMDVLDGGPGQDLFFAALADKVKGQRLGETVVSL